MDSSRSSSSAFAGMPTVEKKVESVSEGSKTKWNTKVFLLTFGTALVVVALVLAALVTWHHKAGAKERDVVLTALKLKDDTGALSYGNVLTANLHDPWTKQNAKILLKLEESKEGQLNFNGRLTTAAEGIVEDYFYIDRKAWVIRRDQSTGRTISASCLSGEQTAPLRELERSLMNSHHIDDSVKGPSNCQGQRQRITFAGIVYVFCSSSPTGLPILLEEDGITISVADPDANEEALLTSDPEIEKLLGECAPVSETASYDEVDTPQEPSFYALATSDRPRVVSEWPWDLAEEHGRKLLLGMSKKKKETKEATHDCFFIHGLGYERNAPSITDSFPAYWGDLHASHKPSYCNSTYFIHIDTMDTPWTDKWQQQEICRLLGAVDGRIRNAMIFTHSMGNLFFAGALANGLCELSSSSAWYNVQAPFQGSEAAEYTVGKCKSWSGRTLSFTKLLSEFCKSVAEKADALADKAGALAEKWIARESITSLLPRHADDRLEAYYDSLIPFIEDNLSGGLCGNSPVGLATLASGVLKFVAHWVGHSESDGVVALSSCKAGQMNQKWRGTYKSPFYIAAINHVDGSCRNRDSWFSASGKPCRWYRKLVPPPAETVDEWLSPHSVWDSALNSDVDVLSDSMLLQSLADLSIRENPSEDEDGADLAIGASSDDDSLGGSVDFNEDSWAYLASRDSAVTAGN